ncbi:zonular occludens toxin domain-containing protein [Undibacterium rugosum]|uniref:zonular occludens toxin domain-containing protein n=1 Tax=Undibacterium rugosum TaxID=2762291 RepID=UPI001B82156F|nr:zonular occludens toxin domain-containing protein [Undibacterium rugosum]MBR7780244.1 zonular occludens toxin [Undibacterium rugosum]
MPGNGKTLYALSYVKQWAEKDNRPVFYSGIKDLALPWTEIDPQKWFECPAGSIIVIDECQTVFRPRSVGKEPPDYVSKLETHRHQGLDIVLITQHPLLADSAIRRLVGKHMHVIRTWGAERATIHEWASARENCDKPAGRADSIKHHWKYDKSAYAYYKSAEVHTVKKSVPMRVYLMVLVPVFIVAAVWYVKVFTDKQRQGGQVEQQAQQGIPQNQLPPSGGSGARAKVSYKEALDDAKQYVFEKTARVEGLEHTAPRYDDLTKPVEVPVPAGCVSTSSGGCKCFTQQATPLPVPHDMCVDIVKHGFFEDFERSKRTKEEKKEPIRQAKAEPKPESRPEPRVEMQPEQGGQWVALGNPEIKRLSGRSAEARTDTKQKGAL